MLSCCVCGSAGMEEEEGGDDNGYHCECASVGKDGGDRGGHCYGVAMRWERKGASRCFKR